MGMGNSGDQAEIGWACRGRVRMRNSVEHAGAGVSMRNSDRRADLAEHAELG